MKHDARDIASDLIDSTIWVIANDGFDKATTRCIAGTCGLADAYIYSCFKGKEDLFDKAFGKADRALAAIALKYLPLLETEGITNENRFFLLFSKVWTELAACPENCRFYVQYYYSPYYRRNSARNHAELWNPIADRMQPIFRPGADVRQVMRLVLNTMLGQAVKAETEPDTDKERIARENYDLILGLVLTCFADDTPKPAAK